MSALQPVLSMVEVARKCHTMFPVIRLRQYGEIYIDKEGKEETATGKEANVSNWTTMSPWDVRKIEREWTGAHANDNVGARMGAEINRPNSWLFCVDEDAGGAETVAQWATEGKILPTTYEQRTWSGKRHRVFRSPRPIPKSIKAIGHGIDIIGCGGLIVFSGSLIRGVRYKDNGHAIVDAPDWLIDLCTAKKASEPKEQTPIVSLDQPQDIRRAIEYLTTEARPAVEGQGGDNTTLKIAAHLKDLAISREKANVLMAEFYNPRCSPPWSAAELDEKIKNAYGYCHRQVPGAGTARAQFEPVEAEPVSDPPWLTELNAEYCVVNEGGHTLVYRESLDAHGHREITRFAFEDFRRLHQNHSVTVRSHKSSKPLTTDVGSAWLNHAKRREYRQGVIFLPGLTTPPGAFNLWRGYGVEPVKGDHSLVTAHLRNVICSGDPALYKYFMGWTARAVQQPGTMGEVAMIFRGKKGVGKGVIGEALTALFGQHSMHIHNAKHLVGQFTGHLRDTVLLFADEAFYAGDRQHESVLKGLVTDPHITIEAKYQAAVTVRNMLHIVMASNDKWVVPASEDERRFCVLDVLPTHQKDYAYFAALDRQLKTGGLQSWLYELLHYDVSRFNVRDVPQTNGLTDQALHSLRGPEAWLYECLSQEYLNPGQGCLSPTPWTEEGISSIPRNQVYDSYLGWSRRTKEYRPATDKHVGKVLHHILADTVRTERPWNKEGTRPRMYVFGPLSQCRRAFERFIGSPVGWEDSEERESAALVAARLEQDLFGE